MAKYRVFAKIKDFKGVRPVTYKTDSDPYIFCKFLDRNFQDWYFVNYYKYIPHQNGPLLGQWTKYKRPSPGKL